ncbi:MAG: aminopeptidase [Oliverpabstia sp.]
MIDPRMTALARQVISYSVNLKKGEKLLIDAWDESIDLAGELMKAAYAAGAHPFLNLQSTVLNRTMILGCTKEGMESWADYEDYRMRDMDAYIVIRKQHNSKEYIDIPREKMDIYNHYYGKVHYGSRIPNTKWCVLRYPSASMAQSASMSTEAFENYFFNACCINYKKMNEIVTPLNERLKKTDQVRITGPGTDITFSIKGQAPEEPICGIFNIPCGEIGMPVIPDSADGIITYNIPSNFQGFVFHNISFTLKKGLIVKAQSNNTKLMNQILDSDPNARRIGEFALGFHPFITTPILDTLFDEKMVMSLHFTPGNSPINPSSIHWDIVTSHAPEHGGGEIWLDGELIRKDGLFLPEDLKPINPEQICKSIAPPF